MTKVEISETVRYCLELLLLRSEVKQHLFLYCIYLIHRITHTLRYSVHCTKKKSKKIPALCRDSCAVLLISEILYTDHCTRTLYGVRMCSCPINYISRRPALSDPSGRAETSMHRHATCDTTDDAGCPMCTSPCPFLEVTITCVRTVCAELPSTPLSVARMVCFKIRRESIAFVSNATCAAHTASAW